MICCTVQAQVNSQSGSNRELQSSQLKQADQQQIKLWIGKLADPSFLVRQNAKSNLVKAGAAAYDQLFRAKNMNDLESRLTIQELLSQIEIHWIRPGDSQQVVDLMLDYQLRPIPDRLAVIDRLSWLPSSESWKSLYQIVIYDKSPGVSDYAAARFMEMIFLRDAGPSESLASGFAQMQASRHRSLKHLVSSQSRWGEKMMGICFAIAIKGDRIIDQPDWVESALAIQRAETQVIKDAADPLRFIEARLIANRVLYQRISRQPSAKSNDVKSELQTLDQIGIAMAVQAADVSITHLLLDCIIENRRYENAAELAKKFAEVMRQDALVGVMIAECFHQAKQVEQGERLAKQSFSMVPPDAVEVDLFVEDLRDRGLNQWASKFLSERQTKGQLSEGTLLIYAELELNRGRTDQSKRIVQQVLEQSVENVTRFRSHLLLAAAARIQKDSNLELRHLESALKLEPLSVGTLVRVAHLSKKIQGFDQVGFRKKVEIAQGAYLDQFRRGTELMNSDLPAEENLGRVRTGRAAYSLAWLLSQLELDLDEALKMARTAVKLEPRNPRYLDALAYCEFQRGNRESAIAIQRRAAFASGNNAEIQARLRKYLNEG